MTLLQIIYALVIGFIVGGIAKLIVPGREPGGCLTQILIGIAGSFLAYFIAVYVLRLPYDPRSPLQPAGFFASLIGAILLLIIYHAIRRRRQ
jgi:uncharacterized membrane protein YeaQ/YmgE (transglycosylase-associated protein family)